MKSLAEEEKEYAAKVHHVTLPPLMGDGEGAILEALTDPPLPTFKRREWPLRSPAERAEIWQWIAKKITGASPAYKGIILSDACFLFNIPMGDKEWCEADKRFRERRSLVTVQWEV